ncbi:MAG: hypothetical protein HKP30_08850, partial [Myxococcales bacterium]|nr:hypothetical protein [Myxococcales bacterium]
SESSQRWGNDTVRTERRADGTEIKTTTDRSGNVTRTETISDEGNRVVSQFGDGTRETTTKHDGGTRTIETVNPDQSRETVHVDANGRVEAKTEIAKDGGTTYTTYDAAGNATVIETDAGGNVTSTTEQPADATGRPFPNTRF